MGYYVKIKLSFSFLYPTLLYLPGLRMEVDVDVMVEEHKRWR